jgi:DNA-binding IclR family transcriptional regulator
MLILDEVAGRHVIGAAGNIGTRWPMHATSTSKAYMAFDEGLLERLGDKLEPLTPKTMTKRDSFQAQIAEIRRRGFATTVDELEDGFSAVATVIRGALGDVQGALSIGGPTQRMNAARRAELGAALCHAAVRLNPRF